jgi:hypothetical protein
MKLDHGRCDLETAGLSTSQHKEFVEEPADPRDRDVDRSRVRVHVMMSRTTSLTNWCSFEPSLEQSLLYQLTFEAESRSSRRSVCYCPLTIVVELHLSSRCKGLVGALDPQ